MRVRLPPDPLGRTATGAVPRLENGWPREAGGSTPSPSAEQRPAAARPRRRSPPPGQRCSAEGSVRAPTSVRRASTPGARRDARSEAWPSGKAAPCYGVGEPRSSLAGSSPAASVDPPRSSEDKSSGLRTHARPFESGRRVLAWENPWFPHDFGTAAGDRPCGVSPLFSVFPRSSNGRIFGSEPKDAWFESRPRSSAWGTHGSSVHPNAHPLRTRTWHPLGLQNRSQRVRFLPSVLHTPRSSSRTGCRSLTPATRVRSPLGALAVPKRPWCQDGSTRRCQRCGPGSSPAVPLHGALGGQDGGLHPPERGSIPRGSIDALGRAAGARPGCLPGEGGFDSRRERSSPKLSGSERHLARVGTEVRILPARCHTTTDKAPAATAGPTPSGICPAEGGDPSAGFRPAESRVRTSVDDRPTGQAPL